jgi:ACS family pantothenate transporter-like MFS transporter
MSKDHESTLVALPSDNTSEEEQKPRKRGFNLLWDTLDKSPEERKFLFKLDTGFLTIACLGTLRFFGLWRTARWVNITDCVQTGYFIKYLDQSNLFNAFVSGL